MYFLVFFGVMFFLILGSKLFSQNFSNRSNVFLITNMTSNLTSYLYKKDEQLLEEIKKAYEQRNYDKVSFLAKKLSPFFTLRPEESLLIAESLFLTGHLKEASEYAQKVITVKRGTLEACKAELIKYKAFIVAGKGETIKSELKNFLGSYCEEIQKKEAKVLLFYLKSLTQKEISDVSLSFVNRVIRELYKVQINALLNEGKLEEARNKVFYYINVYGTPEEASELMLKLAESYFKKGEKEKAKTLYEVIITFWDQGKPALISKFRLYQIAYEKVALKELLPQKTKEDLLNFISQIKFRLSGEPIAEEANFLEIQVLKEIKNYKLARKSALEFIKNFPQSLNITKVKEMYCEIMNQIFNEEVEKENFTTVLSLENEDREILKYTNCGEPYYVLGDAYLKYNFLTAATLNFIKAFETGVKKETKPFLFLKASFVALETKEYQIFELLFRHLLSLGEKSITKDPLYFYLITFYEGKNDPEKGERYLNQVLGSNLPPTFKQNVLSFLFREALAKQKFSKALSYLKNPYFKPDNKDFALLLLETLGKNKTVFEETLALAKKSYPEDYTISLIEAYYLERQGKLKGAEDLWRKLTKGPTYQGELARIYEKTKHLVEKAQELVY